MSPEQQQLFDELLDLRSRVALLRERMVKASPAAEELLKAAERILTEEIAQCHTFSSGARGTGNGEPC